MSSGWHGGDERNVDSPGRSKGMALSTRPPDAELAQRRDSAGHRARRRLAGAGVALLCLLALLGLLFHDALASVFPAPVPTVRTTPSATAALPALPAFSDWRVAYVGQDDHLHAVSLDGGADVAGMALPTFLDLQQDMNSVMLPGTSPDGHYLAYPGYHSYEVIIQVAGDHSTSGKNGPVRYGSYTAFWSPDSTHIVGSAADQTGIWITTVGSWQDAQIPGTVRSPSPNVLGWIDNTHLLVSDDYSDSGGGQHLAALDITSGTEHVIASLPFAEYGAPGLLVSADGAHVLVVVIAPADGEGERAGGSYGPLLEVVDTATGQIHKLPNTLKLLGTRVSALAWEPASATLAVSTGELPYSPTSGAPDDFKLWLVDAQHDTARQLPAVGYPLAWAPAGAGSTLITSTFRFAQGRAGPFTISALTVAGSDAPTVTTLTRSAMTYPLLGLVRSA